LFFTLAVIAIGFSGCLNKNPISEGCKKVLAARKN